MIRSLREIEGYAIHAVDGRIGKVYEFLFDTFQWAVRYVAVDLGGWISDRKVILSARAIEHAAPGELRVNASREKIRTGPDIDTIHKLDRSAEAELHDHYSWPYYWQQPTYYYQQDSNPIAGDPYTAPSWPAGASPEYATYAHASPADREKSRGARERPAEPMLRETRDVHGYHIHALDGDIGHVHDFAVEDETWKIRYVIVDTRNLLPAKHVALSPRWIQDVNWEDRHVYACQTKEKIRSAPAFDGRFPIPRAYEDALFEHYGSPKYWEC